jgi:hypothetical protein
MPHRIEVDVVQMRREIAIVSYQTLRVPALPDRPLTSQVATDILCYLAELRKILPRESLLNETPDPKYRARTGAAVVVERQK